MRARDFRPARLVKNAFRCIGLRLEKLSRSPDVTLLGLAGMPFRSVIDVGANRGQFARSMIQKFPQARIHSFEPLPVAFDELSAWASKHPDRVCVYNLALGAEERQVSIHLHDDHTPSSSVLATTDVAVQTYPKLGRQHEVVVQQKTLDAVFEGTELEKGILIKLDVQGYEDRVIEGGKKIFSLASACICEISLDHLYRGQATFEHLLDVMLRLGYRYAGNISQVYGIDGHCVYIDALFVNKVLETES